MCFEVDAVGVLEWLRALRRASLVIALVSNSLAFIFFWTGFGVPDWLELRLDDPRVVDKKFGLWSICVIKTKGSVLSCSNWASSTDLVPDFLKTTQVLVTLGCIFGTFSLALGSASFFLKDTTKLVLELLAAVLSFVSALFLMIGVAVFGGDFASYSISLGAIGYARRWGYWLNSLAIVLLALATTFYLMKVFHIVCVSLLKDNESDYDGKKQNATLNPNLTPHSTVATMTGDTSLNTSAVFETGSTRSMSGDRSNETDKKRRGGGGGHQSRRTDTSPSSNQQTVMFSKMSYAPPPPSSRHRVSASQSPSFRFAGADTRSGYFNEPVSSPYPTSANNSNNNRSIYEMSLTTGQAPPYLSTYRNYFNPAGTSTRPVTPTTADILEVLRGVQQNLGSINPEQQKTVLTKIKKFKYFYDR